MSKSAFGVEHGEVSKAMPNLGGMRGMLKPMQDQSRGFASGLMGGGGTARPGFAQGARLGAQTRAGGMKAKNFTMKNKKPLAIGGGVGAGVGLGMNRR